MVNALLGITVYLAVAFLIALPIAWLSVKVWEKAKWFGVRLPKWAFLLFPFRYLDNRDGMPFGTPFGIMVAYGFARWFEEDCTPAIYIGLTMMLWPLRLLWNTIFVGYLTLYLFLGGLADFIVHIFRFFVPKRKMET